MESLNVKLPRLVIAATSSGSGKTTITTGILSALRQRGISVQSYKIGPDYIDPGYHRLASGTPAHNLDSWLMPEDKLKEIFARRAAEADIAVIEGVMGMYDGGNKGVSSTAEIAKLLDAPVLLVINCKSMGASAAAIALGFKNYDPKVKLAGVILNRLGSDNHQRMIVEALKELDIPVYGAIRRNDELAMPERHLGLLPVEENKEQSIIDKIGQAVGSQVDLDGLLALAQGAAPLKVSMDSNGLERDEAASDKAAEPVRIAVAKDDAFSFYYPESLRILEKYGAEIVTFSPLQDKALPEADGLILGGGFPEMFASQLSANSSMLNSVRQAAEAGMPIYAECGGFMYLTNALVDFDGYNYPMAGVLQCYVEMKKKLQTVGYVEAQLQADSVLGPQGTKLHGHEFHFSTETALEDNPSAAGKGLDGTANGCRQAFTFTRLRNGSKYGAGYINGRGNVLGSYLHIHFAGCEHAAKCFVDHCRSYMRNK